MVSKSKEAMRDDAERMKGQKKKTERERERERERIDK